MLLFHPNDANKAGLTLTSRQADTLLDTRVAGWPWTPNMVGPSLHLRAHVALDRSVGLLTHSFPPVTRQSQHCPPRTLLMRRTRASVQKSSVPGLEQAVTQRCAGRLAVRATSCQVSEDTPEDGQERELYFCHCCYHFCLHRHHFSISY